MERLFRCDICGKVNKDGGICCDKEMKDLTSSGCMACGGCGFHN